jgi:hypothetical protein
MVVWNSFHAARPSSALRQNQYRYPLSLEREAYFAVSFPNFPIMTSPFKASGDTPTCSTGAARFVAEVRGRLRRTKRNVRARMQETANSSIRGGRAPMAVLPSQGRWQVTESCETL